jgi:hypothetical protein
MATFVPDHLLLDLYDADPPVDDELLADPPWWALLGPSLARGRALLGAVTGADGTAPADGADPRAGPAARLAILAAARLVELPLRCQPPWRAYLCRERDFYVWHGAPRPCAIPWLPASARRLASAYHQRAVLAALEEVVVATARAAAERQIRRAPAGPSRRAERTAQVC